MIAAGHYRTRLAKGAPFCPVLIFRPCPLELEGETFQWIDRWHRLVLLVAGEERAFPEELRVVIEVPGERWAPAFERWPNVQPISPGEYHFRIADQAWCRQWAPDLPPAQPRERADLASMPAIF